MQPITCATYVRRFWRLLTFRWLVLALLTAAVVVLTGGDLRTDWPMVFLVSGTLNLAWIWVA
jgi:hypothetical protein